MQTITKLESYQQLKDRHQKEVGEFKDMFWAFNNDQFEVGMGKLGLTIKDTDKIVSIGGGGYILNSKKQDFINMVKKQGVESVERQKEEKYLIKALAYELNNHKYSYTGDPQDALNALGLDEIDPKIMKKAIKMSKVT